MASDVALRERMTERREAGDLAGALAIAEELLAENSQTLGPRHPDSLALALAVANWRRHLGDAASAADELSGLVPLLETELGPENPDTVTARHLAASLPGNEADPAATAANWFRLFADEQRTLGPDHALTLAARHNLAICRRQTGDVVGAIDEMEEAAAARGRLLGQHHPDTLASRLVLAAWRGESGDTQEAADAAASLIPLLRRAFGPDHEQTLTARHLCALWAPVPDGRQLESVWDWAVLVDDESRALGADHPLTVAGRAVLAVRRAGWEGTLDELQGAAAGLDEDMETDRGGEPDATFPAMTVGQLNTIRDHAARALAENGVEAALTADGTAFVRPDGMGFPLSEVAAQCADKPPEQWGSVVAEIVRKFQGFAKSASAVESMGWAELATRLRSRVVSSAEVAEAGDSLSYAWPLAAGLHEVLCLDFPDVVTYLNTGQVRAHDIDRLREVARRNTIGEPLEGVQRLNDEGADVLLLYGKSSFVASKVLDPTALAPHYIGDTSRGVVVGVPARNYLLVHPVTTAAKLLASLNVMSGACPLLRNQYPGPISAGLVLLERQRAAVHLAYRPGDRPGVRRIHRRVGRGRRGAGRVGGYAPIP
ncbi:tetratricopeptide repeat protein [Mycobacterium sp. 050134]|uniref:tetratricopeptide repeat protein n=1 Tax=Mycobacterium sp. 050134 TaxID=3096111 RepID=UPI002ED8E2D9